MSRYLLLMVFLFFCTLPVRSDAQSRPFMTDSLLRFLATDAAMARTLQDADTLYRQAGLSPDHISRNAFRLGYLEKAWIDWGYYPCPRTYRKKQVLTIVDFTKAGNRKRLAVVDLQRRKKRFDALVSHGSAKGKNGLNEVPHYFCNTMDSWCSSPGLMLTGAAEKPENPCHLCKYTLSRPHACLLRLTGLEKGINDSIFARDIVMHTTGSRDFSDSASRYRLGITDTNYSVAACNCTLSRDSVAGAGRSLTRTVSSYATACAIADNHGYIGRSNGCLTLPEENHIGILAAIRDGSLIFCYTDARQAGYLTASPVLRSMLAFLLLSRYTGP